MNSIEAGLKGASVVGVDARCERMKDGAAIVARMSLSNIEFRQADIRNILAQDWGTFDVVYCLGILYHLDADGVFAVLENVYGLCDDLLVIDTWVAPSSRATAQHRGQSYGGRLFQEHRNQAPPEQRQSRLLASLDNSRSFILTRDSLIRVLVDIGFTSVLQCEGPLEPGKPEGRITLVARKHSRVRVATYPWVNHPSEDELAAIVYPESEMARIVTADYRAALAPNHLAPRTVVSHAAKWSRQLIARTIKSGLRRFGYELRQIEGDGHP